MIGKAVGIGGVFGRATRALSMAAALSVGALMGADASAQSSKKPDYSDAMIQLFDRAKNGSGDPHMPYVLNDLKKALGSQNLLAFLELVQPAYFNDQFRLLHKATRSPGATMGQFACEFFSVCDISKRYRFTDIVSAHVLSVKTGPGLPGGLAEVRLELRMWDGLTLIATIFYDPASAKILAASG